MYVLSSLRFGTQQLSGVSVILRQELLLVREVTLSKQE